MTEDANNDRVLVVKGIAGMGNRMLSVLTAMLYSRLTSRRLVVDWRDSLYSEDSSNIFFSFFQTQADDLSRELLSCDSVAPAVWQGNLDKSINQLASLQGTKNLNDPRDWERLSIMPAKLDYQERVLVLWTFFENIQSLRKHFTGPFAPLRRKTNVDILKDLLKNELQLQTAIQKCVEDFKRHHFTTYTIGVHVRNTDKITNLSAINKKLDRVLKEFAGAKIFLATDSHVIQNLFKKRYGRIIVTNKWYPESEIPIFLSPDCPNRVESAIEALVDMYLLAECDDLIFDASSAFGYVASLLSRTPDSRKFNVQRSRVIPSHIRYALFVQMQIGKIELIRRKLWFGGA